MSVGGAVAQLVRDAPAYGKLPQLAGANVGRLVEELSWAAIPLVPRPVRKAIVVRAVVRATPNDRSPESTTGADAVGSA